jgi:hypothetical protein
MTRQYLSNAAAYRVARDAKDAMNAAYDEYIAVNNLDYLADGSDGLSENDTFMDDCELYLYVRSNEDWIIDHAQYLTDHRNIIAAIPLAHYSSIKALQADILADQSSYA